MLDDAFWPALWSTAAIPSGTRPEVLLTVWFAESGLNPAAENGVGCIGLNQSCPKPLGGPGFPNDDAGAYKAAPASEQLRWIAPQLLAAVHANGGPFESAARYWQANMLPASLGRAKLPDDIVCGEHGPYAKAYQGNKWLDWNRDGVITVRDLGQTLTHQLARRGASLWEAIGRAYAAAPPGAPWTSPALIVQVPDPARPAGPSAPPGGGGATPRPNGPRPVRGALPIAWALGGAFVAALLLSRGARA